MRIYTVTDLEGVAGVYTWENRDDDSLENHERRCRQRWWLAEEVNAAARGFQKGGATECWFYTIDMELLDPGIRIFHGQQRPSYCTGLDEECDGLASLGTHAKAGTDHANLYHTMGTAIRGYWINDISVGEPGYQAFLAGHFGVPFIFCTGDAYACKEMEELVPGCVTVPVKEGLSRLSARTVTPAKAREMIEEGAEEAVRRVDKIEPLTIDGPVTFREEWHEPHFDPENPPPHTTVIDSHTGVIEAEDMVDLMNKKYGYDPDYEPLWKTWRPSASEGENR
jgi:D-amino peptidase